MKLFTISGVLAVIAVAGISGEQIRPEEKAAGAPPATNASAPAKGPEPVSGAPKPPAAEKPLLLLDEEPPAAAAKGGADNSRCQVCHINLVKEE